MLKNYITIAWRNLIRHKAFSFINLTGLAIGLCCFLLIGIYVMDELSYDRYNTKADRICRVNFDARWGGQDIHFALTPDVMGPALKKDYPQVEAFTRIFTSNDRSNKFVRKGTEMIPEERVAYVDSTFFDVFTMPVVDGDTKAALNEPNTAVITASTANRYFGSVAAAGKVLEIKDNDKITQYKVKAVIRDIPQNSHFRFNVLLAMQGLNYRWGQAGN